MPRHTQISIDGEKFLVNGKPTYPGYIWQDASLEGLLLNARMVQGIFDDLNPATRSRWAYPDTGVWDAQRNTNEFINAIPEWRAHGLLSFTINLQGGSPQGYSASQPWENSAIRSDGSLRPDYMKRLAAVLDRADQLGMAVILGIFYFGQAYRLVDEKAIYRAVEETVQWIFEQDYRNVLIEVNNECNIEYDAHPILQPARVHELIQLVKSHTLHGRPLLVSTSYGGGTIPTSNVLSVADFVLMHGNGVAEPAGITSMVQQVRAMDTYHPMPVLFNEDDHFNFDRPECNFTAAVKARAGWGYFDYRLSGESFDEGYQSVPVNWGISSQRKRDFFNLLKEITGGE